jgi:hypothetical protein
MTYQFKEDEVGRACSSNGESRNAFKLLVRSPEGKKPLGKYRCSKEDNSKMELSDIQWRGMDWIDLAQGSDQWCNRANTAMKLRSP